MPIGAIGAGIGGISSLIGSFLGGPSNKFSQTTKGNYDPTQVDLLRQLWSQYMKALGMGTDPTQSDINAMNTGVNLSYGGVKGDVESSLTARGYGESGSLGEGFRKVDQARVGAQQQGRQALNTQALQRYLSLLGMGQGVVGAPLGGTTSSGTGSSLPGVGGAISGIGTDISSLLWLSKLFPGELFGGGGASPAGGGGSDWSSFAFGDTGH